MTTEKKWLRGIPLTTFLLVFAGHAFFIRYQAAVPSDGWADVGVGYGGTWGFDYYVQAQDYYMGFSYALGAAFAVWAILKYLTVRQAAMAAGAAGSVTLVGILMGAGCFMVGCCGSPMLGIYAGLFGVKALGIGKPLMALSTLLSVGFGYWYLSRRMAKMSCCDSSCKCNVSKSS
jgi:hypothetical protein